ncbi:EF-hand domain-containing protein [Streptomyces vinaceus]|uniref:EF-hand domain-containing protein n=1 Tax=Streptomyces vinaceus TaxID=1960 RepID=UPI003806F042
MAADDLVPLADVVAALQKEDHPGSTPEKIAELGALLDRDGDGLIRQSHADALAKMVAARDKRVAEQSPYADRPTMEDAEEAGPTPDSAAEAFKLFDADGDGFATVEEIRAALRAHPILFFGKNVGLPPAEAEALFDLHVSQITRHDQDGDGAVSLDEFRRFTALVGSVTAPSPYPLAPDSGLNLELARHQLLIMLRTGIDIQAEQARAERALTETGGEIHRALVLMAQWDAQSK